MRICCQLRKVVTAADRTLPLDVDRLIAFTEYAVPLRYEDLLDVEPLDRDAAVTLVEEFGRWAEDAIETAEDADASPTDHEE